ncbi:hypothetical protein [Edaphobacter sp.]|uniref:hypothetical protein n=1 Tax=Edaphobacter sp. TaxID=1934404 RepID=UPI002DBF0FFC|nr:hypothetical protein [Edaphobacter sp.]HEU5340154.1 hypothetical protein [Edaphobacter sp.]
MFPKAAQTIVPPRPRLIQTKTGPRVRHSNRHDPIVLPPIVPVTAEQVWTARVEMYKERAAKVVCPAGARLLPLDAHPFGSAPLFAIVDEDDFERASEHRWRVAGKKGKLHAWTIIGDEIGYRELKRFIMKAARRNEYVRHQGDPLDCRKSKLRVERVNGNAGL